MRSAVHAQPSPLLAPHGARQCAFCLCPCTALLMRALLAGGAPASLWAPPVRALRTVPAPQHYSGGVSPVSQQGNIPQVLLTPAQVSFLQECYISGCSTAGWSPANGRQSTYMHTVAYGQGAGVSTSTQGAELCHTCGLELCVITHVSLPPDIHGFLAHPGRSCLRPFPCPPDLRGAWSWLHSLDTCPHQQAAGGVLAQRWRSPVGTAFARAGRTGQASASAGFDLGSKSQLGMAEATTVRGI